MDQKTLDEIKARWEATFGFGEKPDNRQYLERAVSIAQYDIPALLDYIAELQAERDHYKVRAEAMERALRAFESATSIFSFACLCCIYKDEENAHRCNLLGGETCEDLENWQFDEARFAEEGERG